MRTALLSRQHSVRRRLMPLVNARSGQVEAYLVRLPRSQPGFMGPFRTEAQAIAFGEIACRKEGACGRQPR